MAWMQKLHRLILVQCLNCDIFCTHCNMLTYIFFLLNVINLIILLPPFISFLKCKCDINTSYWFIIAYLALTILIVIVSILINLNILDVSNELIRVGIIAYFLITVLFVESSMRYMTNKNENCQCNTEQWLTSLTLIRVFGVYIFGIVLMSAGMFLFIRSKSRPFSFPRSKPRIL